MIEIAEGQDCVTVINVFRVREGMQATAVERLVAVNARIAREPGWISASVHRGVDGERIANYAQWQGREELVAALRHPDLAPLLASLTEVAESDWHLYEVASTQSAS